MASRLARSLRWLCLVCLSVYVFQNSAQADGTVGRNGLHYALNGAMSGPLYVDIDFDTGRYSMRAGAHPGDTTALTENTGQLSGASVSDLKNLAAEALRTGMENDRCRESEKRGKILMPIMDAVLSMTVTLDGRAGSAPVRSDCWSDAASELGSRAYKLVTVASKKNGGR